MNDSISLLLLLWPLIGRLLPDKGQGSLGDAVHRAHSPGPESQSEQSSEGIMEGQLSGETNTTVFPLICKACVLRHSSTANG